ncbi:sucrase ferredoxin [Intrasporangium sp.]|uniref:sucrase ferredoxin n=1 Tax=Intrasporangium sp. TaxID=1925024 RepID=UPI00293B81C7|nr:sucrase ferredoxin [Intrasporangium sp.]MDV3220896.1 sucrase ferredoxin [Intrasporangium sp.]
MTRRRRPAVDPPAEGPDVGQHPYTAGHGRPADNACSVLWDRDATSAFGTSARAAFLVVVEQPGPWGRVAARESHLGAELGAELDSRCGDAGGRFMLIRRPGGHPDHEGPRRVLVAHAGIRPDEAWLLSAEVARPGDLLALDWSALARGHRELVRASLPGARDAPPHLLICTNGRRDVCCAVRGRPLAAALAQGHTERVWEVSHTGGHRFAPTAVLLPWGQGFARLDEATAGWILSASDTGHVPRELLGRLHDRGRSPLSAPEQAAESEVRELIEETRIGALWAVPGVVDEHEPVIAVAHEDGRSWRVRVRRHRVGRQRPESCGKAPVDVVEYAAEVVAGPDDPV